MRKHQKGAPAKKDKQPLPHERALRKLYQGPLGGLARCVGVHRDNRYPMARGDWAYVTSQGAICLNPRREASVPEWEYVLAHCMLHLGLGHLREDRLGDPLWGTACDLAVTRFLQDCRIGTPPVEFTGELPLSAKGEEQLWEQLRAMPELAGTDRFSTMTCGRPDMVWRGKGWTDYEEQFALSLQQSIRDAVREAAGLEPLEDDPLWPGGNLCREAREWFISSYPLLGAVAADFRLVSDRAAVRRLGVQIAAVHPQLKEIYVNPDAPLSLEEWKFVLAHEFLHAALCHVPRCEERDPLLWNVACDYVINDWLSEMEVGQMPEGVLFDQQFHGMTAEAVYDLLWEDVRYYRGRAIDDLIDGDGSWWDTLEGGQTDAFYRSALQRGVAYHQGGGRGFLPKGLVEEIHAISRSPIRWDVELAKWFDENFAPLERRRSYARLSRRQSSTPDIPRPAWRMEETPGEQRIFGVILDTSGSMDRALLAAALGSIASYSQAREVHHVRVVFCDAAPYDQGIMHPEEIAGAVKVRGRGGTVLQPAVDLLNRDPKFPKDAPVLIITDGDCDRLTLRGRNHAFLVPAGNRLPFPPKGPVFRLK